jgi:hypothetical protein
MYKRRWQDLINDLECLNDTPDFALRMLAWRAVFDERNVILINLQNDMEVEDPVVLVEEGEIEDPIVVKEEDDSD